MAIASAVEVEDLIKARYPLIYIVSSEERRVEEKLESRQLNGLLIGYIGNFRRAQGRTVEARDCYARACNFATKAFKRESRWDLPTSTPGLAA